MATVSVINNQRSQNEDRDYRGVLSDTYYLHKADFDKLDQTIGGKTGPVDMNAACVWEKPGNGDKQVDLSEIQDNIRERFGLQSVSDFAHETNGEDGDY